MRFSMLAAILGFSAMTSGCQVESASATASSDDPSNMTLLAIAAAGGCDPYWASFVQRYSNLQERKYTITTGFGEKRMSYTEIQWTKRPSEDEILLCSFEALTEGVFKDLRKLCGKDANGMFRIKKANLCAFGDGELPFVPTVSNVQATFRTESETASVTTPAGTVDAAFVRTYAQAPDLPEQILLETWSDAASGYEIKSNRYVQGENNSELETTRELVAIGDDVPR